MIELEAIQALVEQAAVPFENSADSYRFQIDKAVHRIVVELLKTGQYIFVSVVVGQDEYPVEHIEFYENEGEEDVLEEAAEVISLLSRHPSRSIRQQTGKEIKMTLEILKEGRWRQYGYANTARINKT